MYFVTAGVGTYMHTSNLFSRFNLGMRTTSMNQPEAQRQSRGFSTKATAVQEGTSLSEAALWVRWVHRGNLDADPESQLSLLCADLGAFEVLVASYVDVQSVLLRHARRMLIVVNSGDSKMEITDLFTSEDAIKAEDKGASFRIFPAASFEKV
mmetsp:Transcript_102336/g.330119  ORF Transcript_102336/g.330119 Transcript_102336/m.330119 type:complete len:153 (-) Transcript_102336:128-586(-)